MNRMVKWILVALVSVVALESSAQSGQDIIIVVDKIRNDHGRIMVALHHTDNKFPKGDESARLEKGTIVNGKSEIRITNVPEGTFAIALFHDENDDGKLNRNFIGIPKEGYGFSNNAYHTFRAPNFREASFTHKQNTDLLIHMRY